MGWYRVKKLEVDHGFNPPTVSVDGPSLWTRHGLEGVLVEDTAGKHIRIPREVILELITSEYRDKQVSRYENMGTQEFLQEMGLAHNEKTS